MQLHGFSGASEAAYAGVVYLHITDTSGTVHVSLVMSKTKVAPIKRITIPHLELLGAYLLANLLHYVQQVLNVPSSSVFAWTDSTIVLSWLVGNPRRFKPFVGNRVSTIMELVPPNCWRHVNGLDNPADCASQGMFPRELLVHELWWNGPVWLRESEAKWPTVPSLVPIPDPSEEKQICLHVPPIVRPMLPILGNYSSFSRLKRVTAWVLRFVDNCKLHRIPSTLRHGVLTVEELLEAERYWLKVAQNESFLKEITALKNDAEIPRSGCLSSLHAFLDSHGILRVGGRGAQLRLAYDTRHPIVLPGKHTVTKLLVRTEHLRLLHAGPTLVATSLHRRFHIIGSRVIIRAIVRECVVCRRTSARPRPQMLGQLPVDRLIPGPVFQHTGVDYAGPILIKRGSVRKPTLVKAYVCIFISLSVRAVHIELVSDLTTEAFIATLRRFIARRGKPSVMRSDNGSNFVGVARTPKDLFQFLQDQMTQRTVSEFCSSQSISWKFIPERAPHFGGLWEAAVKSMKTHLRKIVGDVKLNFEELMTVLTQIEACLNSWPLATLPDPSDGLEVLTPGHFLIGSPLETLPDCSHSYQPLKLLQRWRLCQALVNHFWRRWSVDYVVQLRKYTKWKLPSRNLKVGDLVCLQDEGLVPTKWPLARVTAVHPGKDHLVRVITVQTSRGTYKRPVTKIALILPIDA